MSEKRIATLFLVLLAAVALYACYFLARPFFKPVTFAAAIWIIFDPVRVRVRRFIRGANSAALFSTVLIILVVMVPGVLVGAALTHELSDTYHSLVRGDTLGRGWSSFLFPELQRFAAWVAHSLGFSEFDLRTALQKRLEEGATYLPGLTAKLLGNVTSFILNVFMTVFTLFFLLRDGERIKRRISTAMPLNPRQIEHLATGIVDTLHASVYGIVAIAVGQGLLTALGFRILDLPSPVLWGAVTAICSLVPLVGTATVWVPTSIILIITGHWVKGFILLGWGAAIVNPVDNIVRPFLISDRVKLHPLAVFVALVGGLEAFGLMGLLLGPIILSVTSALLSMIEEERQNQRTGGIKQADPAGKNGCSARMHAVPVDSCVARAVERKNSA